jgi:hypothetical protein
MTQQERNREEYVSGYKQGQGYALNYGVARASAMLRNATRNGATFDGSLQRTRGMVDGVLALAIAGVK